MSKEPEIKQVEAEAQRDYSELIDNKPSVVHIRKKSYKLYWITKGQIHKISNLLIPILGSKDAEGSADADYAHITRQISEDTKISCKAAAIYLLHGFWNLRFRYWFLWRWFYYVRQYSDAELSEVLSEGKKKVPLQQFLMNITLLTGARDTLMMMRTAEAEHILHELTMAQRSQAQKSGNG